MKSWKLDKQSWALVNCHLFSSEVVFWAVLKDFEFTFTDLLFLLIEGTVNSELKILQNGSKYHFWGKRTTIYRKETQRLVSIDP